MVQTQSPLIGATYNPEGAAYVAQLERNCVMLCINEAKFRALLELITDEQWDDALINFWDNDALVGVAVANVAKRLKIDLEAAADLVRERWDKYNEPVERTLDAEVNSVVPNEVLTGADLFKRYAERHPEKFPPKVPPVDVIEPS